MLQNFINEQVLLISTRLQHVINVNEVKTEY